MAAEELNQQMWGLILEVGASNERYRLEGIKGSDAEALEILEKSWLCDEAAVNIKSYSKCIQSTLTHYITEYFKYMLIFELRCADVSHWSLCFKGERYNLILI